METTTETLNVKIRPLETSQDWPQFKEGLQEKLEYHSLYKYLRSDLQPPKEIKKDGYSRLDKYELDIAKIRAIIWASCGDTAKNKLKELNSGKTLTPFIMFKHLKKKFSKQNVFSLGILHKVIIDTVRPLCCQSQ